MARPFKYRPELEQLAARTHNRFTIREAIAAGIPDDSVRRMLRAGGLLEVIEGNVLALPDGATTFRSRARTGLLIAGRGSICVRRTAAGLIGMDGCNLSEPIDIYHPRPRQTSKLFVPSRAVVPDEHLAESYGLPHSDVVCTLAQIGAVWPAQRLERAVEWGLRNGTSYAAIASQLGRMGSTGLRTLREVLELRPPDLPVTHSELETRFWQLVRDKLDDMPDRQVPIRDAQGRILFYLDLAWWRWRLYVELDGVAAHSTPTAIFSDRQRLNAITALHHLARLDYTWHDVVERPGYVVDNVRAALATARRATEGDIPRDNPYT